jgi:hypothetical protein
LKWKPAQDDERERERERDERNAALTNLWVQVTNSFVPCAQLSLHSFLINIHAKGIR